MIRIVKIVGLVCLVLLLACCNGTKESDAIWKDVKITDLVPTHGGQQPDTQLLKTANFGVYIVELPVENISVLADIRQFMHTRPLQFTDYDAFGANSFSAGFGQIHMWDAIRNLLTSADATTIETISVLLPDGQADDVRIAILDTEKTIFYISTDGSVEGITIGPGKIALRITTEKIPGSRGVCNVNIQPVFSPPFSDPIQKLAAPKKSGQFTFTPAGLKSKMGPGDFILLAPKQYIDNQMTLAGLFFSGTGRRATVRVYLLICSMINY
ncbi:MAG: hypothetical protein ACYS0I_15525 [Planctomycetota bacterium]|jgi:hypothetical protein